MLLMILQENSDTNSVITKGGIGQRQVEIKINAKGTRQIAYFVYLYGVQD